MTIKEKILKIMSLALEINPPEVEDIGQKRTAVFVRWSPHVNVLGIEIYYGGWGDNAIPDENVDLYTSWEDAHEKLDEIIEMLEAIKKDLEGNNE